MLGPRVNSLSIGAVRDPSGGRRAVRRRPAPGGTRWERVAHAVMARPFVFLIPTLRSCSRGNAVPAPQPGDPERATLPPASRAATPRWPSSANSGPGETSPITILANGQGDPTSEANIQRCSRTPPRRRAGRHRACRRPVQPPCSTRRPAPNCPRRGRCPLRGAARTAPAGTPPAATRSPTPTSAVDSGSMRSTRRPSQPGRDRLIPACGMSPSTAVRPRSAARRPGPRLHDQPVRDDPVGRRDHPRWPSGDPVPAVRLIVIPIKADVMTLLSITASFGALVWIFQEGNLSEDARLLRRPGSPSPATRSSCSVSCSGCRWTTRSCSCRASRRRTGGPATTPPRSPRGSARPPE